MENYIFSKLKEVGVNCCKKPLSYAIYALAADDITEYHKSIAVLVTLGVNGVMPESGCPYALLGMRRGKYSSVKVTPQVETGGDYPDDNTLVYEYIRTTGRDGDVMLATPEPIWSVVQRLQSIALGIRRDGVQRASAEITRFADWLDQITEADIVSRVCSFATALTFRINTLPGADFAVVTSYDVLDCALGAPIVFRDAIETATKDGYYRQPTVWWTMATTELPDGAARDFEAQYEQKFVVGERPPVNVTRLGDSHTYVFHDNFEEFFTLHPGYLVAVTGLLHR